MAQFKDNSTVNGSISASSFNGTATSTVYMNTNQKSNISDIINACANSENTGKIFYQEYKNMYLVNKVFPNNKGFLTINYGNAGKIEDAISISDFKVNDKNVSLSSMHDNNTLEFLSVGNNNIIPLFSYLNIPKEAIDVTGDCSITIAEAETGVARELNITDGAINTDYGLLLPLDDNKEYEISFSNNESTSNTVSKFIIDDSETTTLSTTSEHKGYSCKIVSYTIFNITINQPLNGGRIEVLQDNESHTEDFTTTYGSNLVIRFTVYDKYKLTKVTIGDDTYTSLDDIPKSLSITADTNITMVCELDTVPLNLTIPEGIDKVVIDGVDYTEDSTISLNRQEQHSIEIYASENYALTRISGIINANFDLSDAKSSYKSSFNITGDSIELNVTASKLVAQLSIKVPTGVDRVVVDGTTYTKDTIVELYQGKEYNFEIYTSEGYAITNISGIADVTYNVSDAHTSYSGKFSLSGNVSLGITVAKYTATLSITIPTGVSYITIDGARYSSSTSATLTMYKSHTMYAYTSSGYVLTNISGVISKSFTLSNNTTSYNSTFTMTGNSTLAFTTDTINATLSITIPTGVDYINIDGSKYTSSKSISLSKLTSHTVQMATKPGYVITGLSGVISKSYAVSTMTQSYNGSFNISGNNSLGVTVSQLNITLNVTQSTGGTISVNGHTSNTTIPAGTNFTIAITPAANYKFNYLQINGTKYYEGNTIPSSVLTTTYNNISISANFILMRTVRLDQSNHATLSIQGYTPESDGSYKIPNNTTVTVIAIPEDGYEVTGIEKK